MRLLRLAVLASCVAVVPGALALAGAGCGDASQGVPEGPYPRIVRLTVGGEVDAGDADGEADGGEVDGGGEAGASGGGGAPTGGLVAPWTAEGPCCEFTVGVVFELPDDHFVWKALVRFEDVGADQAILGRSSSLAPGLQQFPITTHVPPQIAARGRTYRYSIRLVSGTGAVSAPFEASIAVR